MATTAERISDPIERSLVEGVSAERLMADTTSIAQWVRSSGSDEERQAFDYLEAQCRAIHPSVKIERFAPDSYISLPGPATLTVLGEGGGPVVCITHSFGASTDGLEGEVVYCGNGTPDELAKAGARGKIALTEGLATPGKMVAAEAAGVAAMININDEHLHEMIVTPIWGAPTPETAHMIPNTPTISVDAERGEPLRKVAKDGHGKLRVRITARVDTGWRPIPCMTAELPGADPNGQFVMFSGHVDSWHYGAMDNGSANATMLEVMRGLAARPGRLRRGLRLAFWSGHSHGRYAASTWYADSHWAELHARCIAHVNVDSTGGIGANVLDETHAMSEATALCADAIDKITGQKLVRHRMSRSSDQSFWGVGLTALLGGLSHQDTKPSPVMAGLQALLGGGAGRGGGLGWWWHTTEDTLDKIDPANLQRDTQIFVLVVNRLCSDAVLPFDYSQPAEEIRDAIKKYAEKAGKAVDLGGAVTAADALVSATGRLNAALADAGKDASRVAALNAAQLGLSRLLVPLNYTGPAGQFDHDLALPLPPVAALRMVDDLSKLDASSDAYKFTRTAAVRASNRVVHTLDRAVALIDRTLG